jgi:signal transduction histidine kinase
MGQAPSPGRGRELGADAALSIGVAGVQLLLLAIIAESARAGWRPVGPAAVALIVGQALPLVVRRRLPVPVFLAVLLLNTVYYVAGFPPSGLDLALAIALYTVAALRSRTVSLLCCAVIVAVCTLLWVFRVGPYWSRASLPLVVYLVVFFSAAWAWGRYHRVRQEMREAQTAELVARAERAERDRTAATRQILAEERNRIARELHDSVAHHMSVMVVQAGAARRVLDADPEGARQALRVIEEAGRRGLGTMPSLVRALRGDERGAVLSPQPGLDRLEEMVDLVRAAGLPVTVQRTGMARPLPPGVELSVYRIVQEALTNTLKHAGPATAYVCLTYGEGALEVTVRDDGYGPSAEAEASGGHGLLGMRERVHLFGGDFRAGPDEGGGFNVHARFPLERGTG